MNTTSEHQSALTAARLREVLSYDPTTGIFRWRIATSFRVTVGAIAGRRANNGYLRVGIDGREHPAHRLAWLYVHGAWPSGDIDHKDGVRHHNWINNLRPATRSNNLANSRRSRANTSGFKGVSYFRRDRNWIAKIVRNGKTINLGYFDSAAKAHAAYVAAAAANFGEFANGG